MTRDDLRARGYLLRWQRSGSRRISVEVFLHSERIAKITGRSERLLREAAYEKATLDFVMKRLS